MTRTMCSWRNRLRAAVVVLALPVALHAQASGERTVDGRVRRPVSAKADTNGMGPAVNAWVTLHRVAKDSAGPLDSVRTDASGRYRMRWRPFGGPDAVYFASVTWGGIAYFTAPLRNTSATGDDAEITVFDTTTRTFPMAVRGRHLIVGKADSNKTRTVVEVFELSNDSLRTLVSGEGPSPAPTWSIGVPSAAADVRATQGEISPDAFAFDGGRVSLFAPLSPGVKQVSFSYALPVESFPLTITADRGAVVFEVLLEEPTGTVAAPGFAAVDPVTIEKRNFRRFLAQDVKDGARIVITVPSPKASGQNLYIAGVLVVIGALMLLVLARAMQRRASAAVTAIATAAPARVRLPDARLDEWLAQEISALDLSFSQLDTPSDEQRVQYESRRAELKRSLAQALAVVTAAR